MSDHSAIEWTDATWSPVTGCTRVSPGCAHCYIERTPPFRMEGRRFVNGTTGVRLHQERLEQPLRWRKPRRVFVCSLADLFHEEVPDHFIAAVYATMHACRDAHTFQVLTKRPERALAFYNSPLGKQATSTLFGDPLPNVWLGVSIENARHTWRADVLREIPAAVRFISAEPLLGSLFPKGEVDGRHRDDQLDARRDVDGLRPRDAPEGGDRGRGDRDALVVRRDAVATPASEAETGVARTRAPLDLTGIDWLIVGGESGPGARPMQPDWARELRDACLAQCWGCNHGFDMELYSFDGAIGHADDEPCTRTAAFFFKQWGEWAPVAGECLRIVGKKRAGRLLDGRTWDEMPTVRT